MDKAKIGMTAQNRVWLAGNVIVKGLLLGDIQMIQRARDVINSEIKWLMERLKASKQIKVFINMGLSSRRGTMVQPIWLQ